MVFFRKKRPEEITATQAAIEEDDPQHTFEDTNSIVIASLEEMNVGDAYGADLPDYHIPITPEFSHPRLHTSEITKTIGEQLEGAEPFDIETSEGIDEQQQQVRKTGSKVLYVVRNRLIPVLRRAPHVKVHPIEEPSNETQPIDAPAKYKRHRIKKLFLAQIAKPTGRPESWYVAAEYELGTTNEETPGHTDR